MSGKEEQDIFGDVSSEPSVADADLNWEADDTFAAAEGSAEVVDEPEAEGDPEPDPTEDPTQDDTEDPAPDPTADEQPAEFQIPDEYKNKTPAEMAKMLSDYQQFIQRQGNELGDLRKTVEQIQQQDQKLDLADPSEYIYDERDGIAAYQTAMKLLGEGKIEESDVDAIIDAVREIAPPLAAKMDRDFGGHITQRQMQQQMAPIVQQSYNEALQRATMTVNQDPDAEAYRADIVRIVQQPQSLLEHQIAVAYSHARTQDELTTVLNAALQTARGANPSKSTQIRSQLSAMKQNERVEPGNASAASAPMTEEDRIIDSLLNPKSGSAELFSGFGTGK